MKIRLGFVSNSSSSSYIIACHEVLDKDALRAYMEKRYGETGKEAFEQYLTTGKAVKQRVEEYVAHGWGEGVEISQEEYDQVRDDAEYLFVDEDIAGRPLLPGGIIFSLKEETPGSKEVFRDSWTGFNGG